MKLLLSTPKYILHHDLQNNKTDVLDNGRGEYYGLTWNSYGDRLAFSYSGIENTSLITLEDYAQSEQGGLYIGGRKTWTFLSQPHQIQWIDNYILVANTGRNTLSRYSIEDEGVKHFWLSDVRWDRLKKGGEEGGHFNSLCFKNGCVYIAAHNFSKGSYVLELEWPTLQVLRRVDAKFSAGIHNIWVTDDDQWIVCDSEVGALRDIKSREVLWCNNFQGYVRGLASSNNVIIVGHSERLADRTRRLYSETGIWVIDRKTWRTLDYINMGAFGTVHDVRIYDFEDECHHSTVLQSGTFADSFTDFSNDILRSEIASSKTAKRNAKRELAQLPSLFEFGEWIPVVATAYPKCTRSSSLIVIPDDAFFIGIYRGKPNGKITEISAKLHLMGNNIIHHGSLIARYKGPGDKNMCAALFQHDGSELYVSFWENTGRWDELSKEQIPLTEIKKVHKAAESHVDSQDEVLCLGVTLVIDGRDAIVYVNGTSVLTIAIADQLDTEENIGIRLHGSSIGFSEFRVS